MWKLVLSLRKRCIPGLPPKLRLSQRLSGTGSVLSRSLYSLSKLLAIGMIQGVRRETLVINPASGGVSITMLASLIDFGEALVRNPAALQQYYGISIIGQQSMLYS
jgi:hypothetical protein